MKNKTKKNKRVKISQKSIIDAALSGISKITVFLIANEEDPKVADKAFKHLLELDLSITKLQRTRAAQILVRAAKRS